MDLPTTWIFQPPGSSNHLDLTIKSRKGYLSLTLAYHIATSPAATTTTRHYKAPYNKEMKGYWKEMCQGEEQWRLQRGAALV